MSVNKYRPHLFVLPEDDANRQLANGFDLALASRQFYILPVAGGWARVRDSFVSEHINSMRRTPDRYMVLLVDFDEHLERADDIKLSIPKDLSERVFIIGCKSKPEELRQVGLGSYEEIGALLQNDCRDGDDVTWSHDLLRHNQIEIDRIRNAVFGFLFSP
jgi:hypothetical protein